MGLSKKIAYRLQTLRASAGLSQQEVAARADLSLSLVTKMEQGRKADPRASTILALSAALGVRPGQLLEDLTAPPEGTFSNGKRGKKQKKAQKKQLPAVVGADEPPDAPPAVTSPAATPPEEVEGARPRKKKKKKGD
ncbi:MAG: helix-turn-helix domain-containing protein [Gemmataceae bacterium]|nr:helix-turn-helix domain-containing protein [Gemmataceae bacterium]